MRALALVALGAAVVFASGATGTVSAAPSQGPKAVKGELIVGFEQGVSRAEQNAILEAAGATSKKRFVQIDAVLVKVKDDEESAVMKTLASDPRVRYAEPNHVVSVAVTPVFPNDPSFSQLWGLHNTGQTGGTADADIDAPEAWNSETGRPNAVVAVSDTGVDFSHPDLAQQQWVNPGENCASSDPGIVCAQRTNSFDDDADGYVDDWRGWDFVNGDNNPFDDNNHGTHVSGTIGAAGNNAVGVVGVNWNVKIMALKFLNAAGSGSTADAIRATLYAADHGAAVSSDSWGGGPFDPALLDAINYGADRNMLFVAAAGNDGRNNDTTPTYPASYDSEAIVAVAATDHNDNLASFSNYGAKSVDLGAPGVNILSTTPGNTYQSFSGTSMATPHVSGAAALVKAHFPGATPYGIKALLLRSVDPNAALSGKTTTNGRLNIATAISCSNAPKVWLGAPGNGFAVGVGDVVPVTVIGANCASPAGLGNVSLTVNGNPVALSATTPDRGLYTGSFRPGAEGPLTVSATVTVGPSSVTQTVTGSAARNYTCVDITDSWVDVTPGTRLTTASNADDGFSTLNITFPFSFYGQTHTTAYVSSNGFLTLGSSIGADAFANVSIPNAATPNGLIAAFWDDLNPAASGDVYAGLTGSGESHVLHVEWFNVPHFSLFGSGTATFEMSLYEATGEIRLRYFDTDLGNPDWNAGKSATAGMEKTDGSFGKQISFNQPTLTSGRAISCTFGPPPPPPAPTITTTTLRDATRTQAYSATLAASGGTSPYRWSLASGTLPDGLSLSEAGAVTGTPSSAAATSSFTVKVTDSGLQSSTSTTLSIAVADPLVIATMSLPGGTAGQVYPSQTLNATGGKTPYAWSVVSGSLPPGLSLDAATGTISGTPTTAGSYPFTAQVTDAGNPTRSDTQTLSITIASAATLTITTAILPEGRVGVSYNVTLAATGGVSPYSWSLASGTLPPGLTLSAGGVVAGTPTKQGNFTFTVRVTDREGTQATKSFSIRIRR